MRSLLPFLLLGFLTAASPSLAAKISANLITHATIDGESSLSVVFEQPVKKDREWQDIFSVKSPEGAPAGQWRLNDGGTLLSFQPVLPGKTYYITPSLSVDASALRLDKKGRMRVDVPEQRPSVRFLGQGPLVPLRGQDVLPVETQYVSGFDVEFLKITDPAAFLRENYGQHFSSWDLPEQKGLYQSVDQIRYEVRKDPQKLQTWRVPLKHLKDAGWYLAVLRPQGSYDFSDFEVRHLIRTNLGVHVRSYAKHTAIFASRLSDGRAIAKGKLSVLGKDGPRHQGHLDEQGFLQLDFRLHRDDVLVLEHGNDIALLPMNEVALDLSLFDVDGPEHQNINAFIWSNRKLLQPGENLPLHVLLRDADGRQLPAQDISLRIVRPDGKEFSKQRLQPTAPGYFSATHQFDASLPQGHWRAQVRTDPSSKKPLATFDFRIESFVPERMQLHLKLADKKLLPDQGTTLDIQSKHLYGSPASGADVQLTAYPHRLRTPFSGRFANYHVGYPQKLGGDPLLEETLTLDTQGQLSVPVPPLLTPDIKVPVSVETQVGVYQQHRLEVQRSRSFELWPFAHMPAIEPKFTELDGSAREAQFSLAKFNHLGQWLPGGDVEVSLLKTLDETYWSYDEARGWRRSGNKSLIPVESQTLSLSDTGPTPLALPVSWGDWVLRVTDKDNGARSEYAFSVGWWEGGEDRPIKPQQLDMVLKKRQWQAGDMVEATVNIPYKGQLVLAFESDRVLHFQRLAVSSGEQDIQLKLPEELARHDVYLSAMLIGINAKSTPVRAIGMLPVRLNRQARELSVAIEHVEKARPNESTRIKVKVANAGDKPTFVTLSAVDRGIINFSRYQVPNPNHFFFKQRRYGGDLSDLYSRLFSPIDAPYAQRRYGAGASNDLRAQERSDNKTFIFMSDAIALDAEGNAEVTLELPDYNGRAQLVAMAFNDTQYGHAVSDLSIAAPVVAELTLPRFVSPGDQSTLSVSVDNTTDSEKTVQLSLENEAALSWLSDLPFAQPIPLAAGERRDWSLPFTVNSSQLMTQLRLRLSSDDIDIERTWRMAVVPLVTREVRQHYHALKQGETFTSPAALSSGLTGPEIRRQLHVSITPPLPLQSSLNALFEYPYGCAEQTTSKALPWLLPNLSQLAPESQSKRDQLPGNPLHRAVQRLQTLQSYSGGFSLWGNGSESPWVSAYVAEFLLRAEAQTQVPAAMKKDVLERLDNYVNNDFPYRYEGDDNPNLVRERFAAQAYAAWLLAQRGDTTQAHVSAIKMAHQLTEAGPLPWVHLSQAFLLLGDTENADKSRQRALAVSRPEAWFGDYGSEVRDSAAAIAILHQSQTTGIVDPTRQAQIDHWTDALLKAIKQRQYLSTQEHVALLYAGAALGLGDPNAAWQAEISGEKHSQHASQPLSYNAQTQIKNTGTSTLWTRWLISGYPDNTDTSKSSLPHTHFNRTYYLPDGSEYQGQALQSGDVLFAHIEFRSTEHLPDALLIERIPAGFRLLNPSLDLMPAWPERLLDNHRNPKRPEDVDYSEYHDDRLVMAFSPARKQLQQMVYALKAEAPGRYQVPRSFIERMYQPDQRAYGEHSVEHIQVTAR